MGNEDFEVLKKKIVPLVSIAFLSSGLLLGPALADSASDSVDYSNALDSIVASNSTGILVVTDIAHMNDEGYKPEILTVTEKTVISKVLRSYQIDPENVVDKQGESILGKDVNLGEVVELYKTSTKTTTEDVELSLPDETVENDELLEGVTNVKTEGKKGKAVKTVSTTFLLGKDGKVETETEENLTVLELPVAKVIEKGTMEPPTQIANATPSNPSYNPTPWSGSGDVADVALAQVGKAYVFGASGPNAFDCSGLVQYAYAQKGVYLPRMAHEQGLSGTPVSYADAQKGDLIYTPGHIGIYLGGGVMVHSGSPATGVNISSVDWMLDQGAQFSRVVG